MELPIYKIKNVDIKNLKATSPLDIWFNALVQKERSQLKLSDISRMLRQDIYIDLALPLAWDRLVDDPLAGEMYEGQLLELVESALKKNVGQRDKQRYLLLKSKASEVVEHYPWQDASDQENYKKILSGLEDIFR